MRAILIDPASQSVSEVDSDGSIDSIYSHLQCSPVQFLPWWHETLWVDEEGLLRKPPHFFWTAVGLNSNIQGRGLLLGPEDEEGESTPATVTLKRVQDFVRWLPKLEFHGFRTVVHNYPIWGEKK